MEDKAKRNVRRHQQYRAKRKGKSPYNGQVLPEHKRGFDAYWSTPKRVLIYLLEDDSEMPAL